MTQEFIKKMKLKIYLGFCHKTETVQLINIINIDSRLEFYVNDIQDIDVDVQPTFSFFLNKVSTAR